MDNFREDPRYNYNLWYTARLWCTVLESVWSSTPANEWARSCVRLPVDRALHAMPQMPQEMAEGFIRHERSRWCHIDLKEWKRTGRARQPHVEHPWTKKITKSLINSAVLSAFDRGVSHRNPLLIEHVAAILDARCDTVLLPDLKTGKLGIKNGKGKKQLDGLVDRYVPGLESKKLRLWDRLLQAEVTVEDLHAINESRANQVAHAVSSIGALESR